ncbi:MULTISPECIES: hypothetical protein [Rhodococcus]|uniref:hypothetical protein n=1 Tax=Rhodococcus TaxID=1827 RepID=UPI001E581030|nr:MULTISPECIES: hypothetical protein [Rhodococcus]MCD5422328.1 hypothetical protein [Rhodococcus pyridinivorans]BDB63489.1 hypothetical protein RDE2_52830 [Rhodococcus sp. RDE2]
MTEQNITDSTHEKNTPSFDAENERASSATKLTIGLAAVALIVVVGVVVSLVMVFRGDDAEPLVSLDPTTGSSATAQDTDGLFEPDPVFDKANRVIYVPLDPNGVILSETLASGNRPANQAPSGVMLQRIHGNMDLPFSTSDGPTGFTDNGVAIGFSRTAQGAALAAAHYGGYFASGTDRTNMLVEAALLSDPNGEAAKASLGIPDSSPASALPMVKVLFNPDLTLVQFGRPVQKSDGSTAISYSKLPLVWRDGSGWVLKIDPVAMGEGTEPIDAAGWSSWW